MGFDGLLFADWPSEDASFLAGSFPDSEPLPLLAEAPFVHLPFVLDLDMLLLLSDASLLFFFLRCTLGLLCFLFTLGSTPTSVTRIYFLSLWLRGASLPLRLLFFSLWTSF